MNLDQGDIALMVANARGLASLGMAGGYDEVLYELSDALEALNERAEAAEARCARLQQALDYIAGLPVIAPVTASEQMQRAAREALAGPDTPADSQEDKT